MGALATGWRPGSVLCCVGLGSCIGLALVDQDAGVAGVAHIVMPAGDGDPPAHFAHTAVPVLAGRTVAAGARREDLVAILVGGAQMFTFGSGQQIGARNEQAVREALVQARIPVVAADTGGQSGRTFRVRIDDRVTASVRTTGQAEKQLSLDQLVKQTGTTSDSGASAVPNRRQTTSEMVN